MTRVLIGGASLQPGWTGGEPLVIRHVAEGFRSRGIEVSLAPRYLGFSGSLALGTSLADWDPVGLARYGRTLRRERPDLVLGFYDYDSSLQIAARRLRVPFVACVHIYWPMCPIGVLYVDGQGVCSGAGFRKCVAHMNNSIPEAHLPLHLRRVPPPFGAVAYSKLRSRQRTLTGSDAMVVPSHRLRALLEAAGCSQIHVVPPGVEVGEFSGLPWSRGSSKTVFLPTASADERKGAAEFHAAAALVVERRPGIRFVATNSPSTAHVEGTPRLSRYELLQLFERSYAVVVPSIWDEVAPATVLEAMAASRPVVAYDVGGISELLVDNVTGLLVPRGDTRKLAEAIGRLIDDEALAQRLGAAGRRRLEAHYSVPQMVDGYLKVVTEVLS